MSKIVPKILKNEYQKIKPYLNKVKAEVQSIVQREIMKLGKHYFARVRITESRVKELGSLWRKTKKKNWPTKLALTKCGDLVGLRIVCANFEDISRVKDAILSNSRLVLVKDSEEDRINKPLESGYRGFHFNVKYSVKCEKKIISIVCEIQIRTELQDSWAYLSHRDIYKEGKGLPENLKKLSKRLSDLLFVADQISQDIREQASQPRKISKRFKRGEISEDALAFIFRRTFNVAPPEYFVKYALKETTSLGIYRLDTVERILNNIVFKRQIRKEYKKLIGLRLDNEGLFLLALFAAVYGNDAAIEESKKRARQEFDEIDAVYKSELRSELPETLNEFISYLSPHTKDDFADFPDRIYRLAKIFEAVRYCSICGSSIVDEGAFAEGALEIYNDSKNEGAIDKIRSIVCDSGVDTGDLEDSTICSYHGYVLSKN
jgi:putative GTP pyrophosphokinase